MFISFHEVFTTSTQRPITPFSPKFRSPRPTSFLCPLHFFVSLVPFHLLISSSLLIFSLIRHLTQHFPSITDSYIPIPFPHPAPWTDDTIWLTFCPQYAPPAAQASTSTLAEQVRVHLPYTLLASCTSTPGSRRHSAVAVGTYGDG
jgi:hypothetical protein